MSIKHKKIILPLLLAPLSFIPFHFSSAAGLLDIAGKSIIGGMAWVVSTLLYLVGYIFSKLVFFGGVFFNWTLELNSQILDNPVVSIGWELTRDIANLGFVLLIIIIAFATILRQGNFQMKSALPKLITAALLINFSLLAAAVVIDSAGIFTNFFINNAYDSTSTQGGISQALATSLSLHKGLQPPSITGDTDLSEFGVGVMNYIANIVFLDIMTIIGAITMFAIGAMFLLRYINLGILLILLPGAILAWVAGSSSWGKWLDKFLSYTFFAPIASFFIYIALKATTIFEANAKTFFDVAVSGDTVLQNLASNIASMIILVSLLLLGLKTAESMAGDLSVGGSKMAGEFLGKLKNTTISGLKGGVIGTGKAVLGGAYAESLAKSGQKLMGSRFTLMRGLGRKNVEQAKELSGQYGKPWAAADIGRNLFEGAAAGLGFGATKIRMGEEKIEKSESKEIERLAKRNVEFDLTKANDESYVKDYNSKLTKQKETISSYLRSTANNNLEATTKEFEKQALIKSLAKKAGVEEKAVSEFIEKNAGDLETTRKYFEREADLKNLISQTGVSRQEAEESLKKNFNNFKSAKDDLKKKKGGK